MHQWACCHDEAANHQLPIAVAFCIIWMLSREYCSRLMQNLMQICCSTHSVILNVTATQYTCSLNSIYHPHWLGQWSHHSHMHTPVHSPWLPGYLNVVQTVLAILTMAGLFPDRPHIPCMKNSSFCFRKPGCCNLPGMDQGFAVVWSTCIGAVVTDKKPCRKGCLLTHNPCFPKRITCLPDFFFSKGSQETNLNFIVSITFRVLWYITGN